MASTPEIRYTLPCNIEHVEVAVAADTLRLIRADVLPKKPQGSVDEQIAETERMLASVANRLAQLREFKEKLELLRLRPDIVHVD